MDFGEYTILDAFCKSHSSSEWSTSAHGSSATEEVSTSEVDSISSQSLLFPGEAPTLLLQHPYLVDLEP